jgi:CRISPR system Cascade subunit CasA
VRLKRVGDAVEGLAAGSKCARVAATELKGKTGDPWLPVKADGSSSHTPTGAGFGYRQMTNLLDRAKVTEPLLARLSPEDDRDGLAIVAAALVRGQGKTEGLHRRLVRTSRVAEIEETGEVDVLDRIGDVARARSNDAGEAGKRLRRALISLVQGGPDQARLDDDAAGKKVDPWVRRFDTRADGVFFDDAFWLEAASKPGDHRRLWRERLRDMARDVFDEAAEAAPRTEMRRIRAIARAKSYLEGQMAKWIGEIA